MLPPQGEPIHDGGAKSWFGERCRPAGERRVGGDGDGVLFLPFGQHLEEQLSTSLVEFHVTEFVEQEEIHSAVTGDRAGELLLVGGFDELVHQPGREDVFDAVTSFGGRGPEPDE